ncbi:MAG: peptidoglycan-binding domain-containing protein [Proteobacteria bacterium]|nr:peptidoglycan-binding domain-containing protein [Pseudomonadota bacterium]
MSKKCLALIIGVIITLSFTGFSIAEEKENQQAEKISKAQEGLKTLGYYKGDVTGKMDKDTRDAVKEFQKKEEDMKMPAGMLTDKTCSAIDKKAEKKTKKDEDKGKNPMDKVQEGMDKMKGATDVVK